MQFGGENSDEEEQRRMAEELGISLDNLSLEPKQKDQELITPANKQVRFQPTVSPAGGSKTIA